MEALVHVAIQNFDGGKRVGKLRNSTLLELKLIQKKTPAWNIEKWRKKRDGVPVKFPDDVSWAAMLEYLIEMQKMSTKFENIHKTQVATFSQDDVKN